MNHSNYITLVLLCIAIGLHGESTINEIDGLKISFAYSNSTKNACPADDSGHKEILRDFIKHPAWSEEREATGTINLSGFQIVVLNDNDHKKTCQELNEDLNDTISQTHSSAGKRYNFTYYKVGNHYFAIITLKQPSDPDSVVFGLSFLLLYDSDLEYKKGYSF